MFALIRPFLPYIAGALILAGLAAGIDHRARMAENARLTAKWQPKLQHALDALNNSAANFRKASEQARANNHAYVVRINTLQDQITKEQNNEYPQRLATARDAVARYVRSHPAADPVHTGPGGASGLSIAPGQLDAQPSQAIVSVADLDACAQSYVTATGLQDWIRKQQAVPREIAQHKDKPE